MDYPTVQEHIEEYLRQNSFLPRETVFIIRGMPSNIPDGMFDSFAYGFAAKMKWKYPVTTHRAEAVAADDIWIMGPDSKEIQVMKYQPKH